jgi:hypothetical protein
LRPAPAGSSPGCGWRAIFESTFVAPAHPGQQPGRTRWLTANEVLMASARASTAGSKPAGSQRLAFFMPRPYTN